MANLTRDVDFLYELGQLNKIMRHFQYAQGTSSVSEHTLRVCFTAMILAKREGADMLKTILTALVHDVPEIRTGDPHPWQKPYVKCDTEAAAADMLHDTSLTELVDLVKDYEKRESLESKIVKDADMIECEMEMRELKEMGSNCHSFFDSHGFTNYVYGKLRTESGKALYKEVGNRRPFDRYMISQSSLADNKHGT